MNGLLASGLLVASTLVAVTDSAVVVTGTAVTVGAGSALAAGALAVGAVAIGAKVIALKAKRLRGKRQAPDCVSFDNPETYFALAANGDFLDCGRRFVCELEATPEENLASEELLIRNLFGRGFISTNGSAGNYYAEAAAIGAANGAGACVDAFSKCPFDRKTLFLAYQEAQTAQ
ncbi:hypothetical protein E2C01_059627 [Portunus trituberculatus]|uniref:Uncharacterized protein n=1 Tax=Portunus trituberculatus TaxID=210409 RepID=A0A5B7H336_PORTR|nr:hypothetical protein [Portunus trituberculatus]